MKCAVIDNNTNLVINLVMADPENDIPHEGTTLVGVENIPELQVGWIYNPNNKTFTENK